MADGFWAVILWLAVKGKIVGDVERIMSGGRVASLDDVRHQASGLLEMGHINDREHHMIAATPGTKWELKMPPMPIPGQLFVADLFCGYMSAWYDWLEPRAREEHGVEYTKLYEADRACNYFERPIVTGVHPQNHVGYLCNDYRPMMWSGTINSRARSRILDAGGLGRVLEKRFCRPRDSGECVRHSIGRGEHFWHV